MGQVAQLVPPLSSSRHPDLLVGTSTCDDAGVFRVRPDLALVQTVDFFAPVVNDPVMFGRIAAANSLSDVWAMGGRAATALNIACFPDHRLELPVLAAILRGGAEVMDATGVALAGGHTMRDEEIKYGLSVTGLIHPDKIITNAGARPGDHIVLTKPLGTGIAATALRLKRCSGELLDRACEVMTRLNLQASEAMLAVGVHAATDVTGFGLAGHTYEMATGAGVDIVLHASKTPFLEGTKELVADGVKTMAPFGVASALGSHLHADPDLDETDRVMMMESQTSGGLLIALPPDRTEDLLSALHEGGDPASAVIGEVRTPSPDGPSITLIP